MSLVRENIGFKRGQDSKKSLAVGLENKIKKWFKENYKTPSEFISLDANFFVKIKSSEMESVIELLKSHPPPDYVRFDLDEWLGLYKDQFGSELSYEIIRKNISKPEEMSRKHKLILELIKYKELKNEGKLKEAKKFLQELNDEFGEPWVYNMGGIPIRET